MGRASLRLREKSRIREYSAPRLYEIAFELNRKGEVDFLVHWRDETIEYERQAAQTKD